MESPLRESLVEYDPPVEIPPDYVPPKKRILAPSGRKRATLPPMENKANIDEYLNAIFPPKEWTHEGRRFI